MRAGGKKGKRKYLSRNTFSSPLPSTGERESGREQINVGKYASAMDSSPARWQMDRFIFCEDWKILND